MNVKPQKDKFDVRAEKEVFVGYSPGQKGYKIYSLDTKNIKICRDVVFHESVYPFKNQTDLPDNMLRDTPLPLINGDHTEGNFPASLNASTVYSFRVIIVCPEIGFV